MNQDYITAVAAILTAKGIPNAEAEAKRFIEDNPGIEDELTPEKTAQEWIDGCDEGVPQHHPARYGAS